MNEEHDKLFMERWHAAAHAMQSGVAMEMQHRDGPTTPKHLRVGVNTALTDHASLVTLLVKKGLITNSEYLEAIAVGMEEEQARYEKHLSDLLGTSVKLG